MSSIRPAATERMLPDSVPEHRIDMNGDLFIDLSELRRAGKYEIVEKVGEGAFGTVYKCIRVSNGRTYAAKVCRAALARQRDIANQEIAMLSQLDHRKIVKLYEHFTISKRTIVLMMELIEGGELFDRIIDQKFKLTEKIVRKFVRQICEGVEYLHSQSIVHLDLKPENILCLDRTSTKIKIIDFGLARRIDGVSEIKQIAGTPEFSAPEVINFDPISFYTDMWAIGVITYILLSGISPFLGENDTETRENITRGLFDFDYDEFEAVTNMGKNFIMDLLKYNGSQRLSATQCLQHKWLESVKRQHTERQKSQLSLEKNSFARASGRRSFRSSLRAAKQQLKTTLKKCNDSFCTSSSAGSTVTHLGGDEYDFHMCQITAHRVEVTLALRLYEKCEGTFKKQVKAISTVSPETAPPVWRRNVSSASATIAHNTSVHAGVYVTFAEIQKVRLTATVPRRKHRRKHQPNPVISGSKHARRKSHKYGDKQRLSVDSIRALRSHRKSIDAELPNKASLRRYVVRRRWKLQKCFFLLLALKRMGFDIHATESPVLDWLRK